MQYNLLGKTGLLVSRFAFGAMTFTAGNRDLGLFSVEQRDADAMVGAAIDAGINLFDTADNYAGGESEKVLGAALGSRRHDVVLATKVGFRSGDNLTRVGLSRRHILWSIDQSLKRLHTDYVDLYIAHRQDIHTPLEETLDAFDCVVRSGKARYIGFSNWTAWTASAAIEIQKARGFAEFTHGQMYYSLLGRDIERDVIPMMATYGLGLTVWSPLAFGLLTGKYTRESLRDSRTRIGNFDLLGSDRDLAFSMIDLLQAIATNHGATLAQTALAWLLSHRAVNSVILGSSKIQQLNENLKAADLVLSPEQLARLDEASALPRFYPNWFVYDEADKKIAAALRSTTPG